MDQNKPPTVKGLGKQLGAAGTYIFSGVITQEEYNQNLVGLNGIRIFDTMRRSDSSIHSTLQVCKLPILSTTWNIDPASEDSADVEIADFVKRELFDRNVNFHDLLREALTMFDFGFSVFEKTYELTDYNGKPRIGIKDLGSRKQRSVLYWQQRDGSPGIQQQLLGGGVNNSEPSGLIDIPMNKLLVFTNEKEGNNYAGISTLRFAYKDWDIKDKLILVHAIALEKTAMGIPVITPPANVNQTDQTKARESVRQMRANEESFVEKPNGWGLEMLDMQGQTTRDILPTIQYLDKQISKSVLAQFLELGAGKSGGSKALSQDHSQLFMLSEEAAAKTVANTLQLNLVQQLCDLNFADLPNGYPKLNFGKIGDDDITVMATAASSLAGAGLLTADPDLEDHIRDTMHFPLLPEQLHEEYEKQLETDPASLMGQPTPPTATPPPSDGTKPAKGGAPATEPATIKEATDGEKTKASVRMKNYHQQLIQDVVAEFADEQRT